MNAQTIFSLMVCIYVFVGFLVVIGVTAWQGYTYRELNLDSSISSAFLWPLLVVLLPLGLGLQLIYEWGERLKREREVHTRDLDV